mmetsp:Transcript_1055/g.2894  ORF Transcript_1055/g.2894 Transcript_1055/m.2894 type:complete len:266 (-) Transcript_1055:284-1081(-)
MPLVLHKDFLRASLAALLPLLGPAAIAIAIAIPGPLVAQGRPRRKLEHQVRTWKPLQWLAPVTNDVLILVDGGARQRQLGLPRAVLHLVHLGRVGGPPPTQILVPAADANVLVGLGEVLDAKRDVVKPDPGAACILQQRAVVDLALVHGVEEEDEALPVALRRVRHQLAEHLLQLGAAETPIPVGIERHKYILQRRPRLVHVLVKREVKLVQEERELVALLDALEARRHLRKLLLQPLHALLRPVQCRLDRADLQLNGGHMRLRL